MGVLHFFDCITLERSGPVPVWRQLYAQLASGIEGGALGAGAHLLAERELAEQLGISRATVRRAYDELRQQQHIGGKGKAGSTVQTPARIAPDLGRLKGFTQEMAELGLEASSKIVQKRLIRNAKIARIFARPVDADFLHIVRVRMADGRPMTREVAYYDVQVAPALASWSGQGSAYDFLRQQCGVPLAYADQSIEAIDSPPAAMRTFEFATPQPCLLLTRKTYTQNQTLVEFVQGTFRGDAYTYHIRLQT